MPRTSISLRNLSLNCCQHGQTLWFSSCDHARYRRYDSEFSTTSGFSIAQVGTVLSVVVNCAYVFNRDNISILRRGDLDQEFSRREWEYLLDVREQRDTYGLEARAFGWDKIVYVA